MTISPRDVTVVINGTGIVDVTDFNLGHTNNLRDVSFLGADRWDKIQSGPIEPTFSFSRFDYATGVDVLKYLTGDVPFSGCIHYNDGGVGKSLNFSGAYLTSYDANFSLNEPPKYSYSIVVFGDVRFETGTTFTEPSPLILPPRRSDINLESDRFSGFCVQAFNYSLKINRIPIYRIGKKNAVEVKTLRPIEGSLSATFYAESLENHGVKDFQQSGVVPRDTVSFSVYNPTSLDGAHPIPLQKDSISGDMNIEGGSVSISTESEMIIEAQYSFRI